MRIAFRTTFRTTFRTATGSGPRHSPESIVRVIAVDLSRVGIDARREQIRRVFESPLGADVSEATLARQGAHIVLHVARERVPDVRARLRALLPDAVIRTTAPRTLAPAQNETLS